MTIRRQLLSVSRSLDIAGPYNRGTNAQWSRRINDSFVSRFNNASTFNQRQAVAAQAFDVAMNRLSGKAGFSLNAAMGRAQIDALPAQIARSRIRRGLADRAIAARQQERFNRENPDAGYMPMNGGVVDIAAGQRLLSAARAQYRGITDQHGAIQSNIYNNSIRNLEDIRQTIRNAIASRNGAVKVNVHVAGLLERKDAGGRVSYKVWKNGINNRVRLADSPILIRNEADLKSFFSKYVNRSKINEAFQNEMPDSRVKVKGVHNVLVRVSEVGAPMGAVISLPKEYLDNPYLNTVYESTGNKCFWACLAVHRGADRKRYMKQAKELFIDYYGVKPKRSYPGVDLKKELHDIEAHFKLAITVYEKVDEHYQIKRPTITTGEELNLLAYRDHLMYIKNVDALGRQFKCDTCETLWATPYALKRHSVRCVAKVIDKFSRFGEIYSPNENVLIRLAKALGVYTHDIDFAYDYHCVFDYEAMLLKVEESQNGKIVRTSRHEPVSCSVNSNVPGFGVQFFCLTDYDNALEMNRAIYMYFKDCQAEAHRLMWVKLMNMLTIPKRAADCELVVERAEWWLVDDSVVEFMLNLEAYLEKIAPRLRGQVVSYLSQLPVLSFNGGMYDINLNKTHGLMTFLTTDGINFCARKANRYMAIATDRLKLLDVSNYIAPGWSYDKYVKAYQCSMDKGFFPYEWCDSLDKLEEKQLPPIEAFYSSLKKSNSLCTKKDPTGKQNYAMLQRTWEEQKMETMRDMLQWYNNLDVIPFVEAVEKQKAYYYSMELDMFKDAVSIPGLAEKIMFQSSRQSVKVSLPDKHKWARISDEMLEKRIAGYVKQDAKAGREYKDDEFLDLATARKLVEESNYRCAHCFNSIGERRNQPERYQLSFDRIDNSLAHVKGNLVVSCVGCNKTRGDQLYSAWRFRSEAKRIHHISPQVKLISDANKSVFYKLKSNIVGGASIIFHRYHEAGITRILRPEYSLKHHRFVRPTPGKMVQRIVGLDANALYLWCLGQAMPCGDLREVDVDSTTLPRIRSGELFGFAEVDIHVPEKHWNRFIEFPPIFRNTVIEEENIGDYMRTLRKKLDKPGGKNRKLISSFAGTKILLYTPLLRWYLEHGLVVSRVHSFIKATKSKPFEAFTNWVSDARRDGDKDPSMAIRADSTKLVGNSAFGRTGMNKSKHNTTKYLTDIYKARRRVNSWTFRDLNEIKTIDDKVVFEITQGKRTVRQNCPLQVASAVYQMAKLRMLEFYHDCVDKFIDRADYQYIEMDTDSAYMAITSKSINDIIKPSMREQWEKERYDWFPDNRTPESKAYQRRTPGLFKVEWEGDAMVALTSKMYCCRGDGYDKSSAKGIQASKNAEVLQFDNFKKVLDEGSIIQAENRGLRAMNGEVFTYQQKKDGLCPIYDKRIVLEDGVCTIPLLQGVPMPEGLVPGKLVDAKVERNEIAELETMLNGKEFYWSIERAYQVCLAGHILIGRDVMFKDKQRRMYTTFRSYERYFRWLKGVDAVDRTFHEMVRDHETRRLYFDFDREITGFFDDDKLIEVKQRIESLLEGGLDEVLSKRGYYRARIHFSHQHRPGKLSVHAIVKNLVGDANMNRSIAVELKEWIKDAKLNSVRPENIDLQVYGSLKSLRMPGSSKLGLVKYPKPISMILLKNFAYADVKEVVDKNATHEYKERSDNVSHEMPDDLPVDDPALDAFEFRSITDNRLVNFNRLRPSHCDICERIHHSDNTAFLIRSRGGWKYGCTRSKGRMVDM